MARVSTYLNFMGTAEEAFGRYREVFGTDYLGPVLRLGDMPPDPAAPGLPDGDRQLVAHVELPILAGHVLMGTDMVSSMGHELRVGNNTTIVLEVDTRAEADRLYGALAEGGSEGSPMADMPWGAYWGTCLDRFDIRWMFSCAEPAA